MKDRRRRRGPDWLVRLMWALNGIAWLALLGFQCLWWLARPEMDTGLVRYYGLELRTTWLTAFVNWMPAMLIGCTALSLAALGLTRYRSRRHLDGRGRNLWLLLVLITGSTVFYLVEIR